MCLYSVFVCLYIVCLVYSCVCFCIVRLSVSVCLYVCPCWLVFYVSLTQDRIVWEEETAAEKMPLQDCPMSYGQVCSALGFLD